MGKLHTTRALCPECMRVLPAQIIDDKHGKVWMVRACPEHGSAETLVWPDVDHYRWITSLAFPQTKPAQDSLIPSALPCPTGCGICQRHKRKPTLVEVEVTQRCNLSCPVCFMSADPNASSTDVPLKRIADFYETIAKTVGTQTGVQITGGEPTIRKDLPQIIALGRQQGFWGIEVNTNGLVIAQDNGYLEDLVTAGLTGIYLQFDGMTPEPYRQIRGADLLDVKLRAVERCRDVGVQVVLAMTIVSGINSSQIGAVIDFALDNVDVIAGVALQPAFTSGRFDTKRATPLTMGDVIFLLQEQTKGLIGIQDIWPLGCSHPLCDTGTFLVPTTVSKRSTSYPSMSGHNTTGRSTTNNAQTGARQDFIPITRDLDYREYLASYDPDSPQGSVFGDIMAKKYLLSPHDPLDPLSTSGSSSQRGLSLIIMNYMDAITMDLERMEECSMFVTMPDGRLIPFCSYQLTDCLGKRVYPPWGMQVDKRGAVHWDSEVYHG